MGILCALVFFGSFLIFCIFLLLAIVKKITHKGPANMRRNLLIDFVIMGVSFILMAIFLSTDDSPNTPTTPNDYTYPEVVTEETAEVETEEVTEIITEAPTEAPTEPPTEPPTEAPTVVVTEAPTEATTVDSKEARFKEFWKTWDRSVTDEILGDYHKLHISYKNTLGKPIKYIYFSADYINTVGDVIVSDVDFRITGPIEVGATDEGTYELDETTDPSLKSVKFKYMKVIYTDDTEEEFYF